MVTRRFWLLLGLLVFLGAGGTRFALASPDPGQAPKDRRLPGVDVAAKPLAPAPAERTISQPAPQNAPQAGALLIPSGAAPLVDGACAEYGDGLAQSFTDGIGTGTVYLKHDGSNLYICSEVQAGTHPSRALAIYLDPQADGNTYTFARPDDFGLSIGLASGVRTSSRGNGSANGWTGDAGYDSLWQAAATPIHGFESAEFSLPLSTFGLGACGAPFALAAYHLWMDSPGVDFGWPSNQWYDQPGTWQLAQLVDAPCTCGGVFPARLDATVSSATPGSSDGSNASLYLALNASGERRILLDFDLGNRLPAGATILQAELQMTYSEVSTQTFGMEVHSLGQDWAESVTWDNQPVAGMGYGERFFTPKHLARLRADVTPLVTQWATGILTHTSLLLAPADVPNSLLSFKSRETGDAPRLAVQCAFAPTPQGSDQASGDALQLASLQQIKNTSTTPATVNLRHGALNFADVFLLIPPGVGSDPLAQAEWFLQNYQNLLRLNDPQNDLQLIRRSPDGFHLFFRQRHLGVPVYPAELVVHIANGAITGVGGNYLTDISLSSTPRLSADEAATLALSDQPGAQVTGDVQLRYFVPSLLGFSDLTLHLAWRVSLDTNMSLFIDANSGALLFSEAGDKDSYVLDLETGSNQGPHADWPCWWSPFITADDQWFDESGVNTDFGGSSPDAEGYQAYTNIGKVYNFWSSQFGRDSYDGDGEDIQMYIHVGSNWVQAHYLSGCDIFEFGDNLVTLDVIAHEFTHGVTDSESGLVYQNQSGALNESFSDIFGQFVDNANWTLGEGSNGGVRRDMSNPPAKNHPDKMSSTFYYTGPNDNGGVHTNSGVQNKAAYLINAGGTFNGFTITGMGQAKTQRLFYNVITNRMFSSAQMIDARNAAVAEAQSLAATAVGWNTIDACRVKNAYAAVELGTGDKDCDGIPDNIDQDNDGDGVADNVDNCPAIANSGQSDWDGDGLGDACDPDNDNDGVANAADNCRWDKNPTQSDWNNNGVGDACDDSDGDGINDYPDNCRFIANQDQMDTDWDGKGDVCDADIDNDGLGNFLDNCAYHYNPDQADSDNDGIGDACDLCPTVSSSDNGDPDHDGLGNPCDLDDDNDGVLDQVDNCQEVYNPNQFDSDQNGIGFVCDPAEQEAVHTKFKILTGRIRYIPNDLLHIPVPICPACATQYLPNNFETQVNVTLSAPFYARIIDSNGNTVAKTGQAAALQTLNFTPLPFGKTLVGLQRMASGSNAFPRLSNRGYGVAGGGYIPVADEIVYSLEIQPVEGTLPDTELDISVSVSEGVPPLLLYLPVMLK